MTTEADEREWPEEFWYLETAGSTYTVDGDTADMIWDAMRQDSPACLEFRTLTGVLLRLRTANCRELTHVTDKTTRDNSLFNIWNQRRLKELEKELDPEKFLRGDD